MSKDQEYDRDAALANLTDEERSALEDDELSPEEKAALEDIAGDEEGDDDEDEDSDTDTDDEETEAVDVKKAAAPDKKAESDSKSAESAASEEEAEAEFRPRYQVQLPDGFSDQVKALDDSEADLARKFKAGEIEADEFLAENKRIAGERSKLDRVATKAEIASEMGEQTQAQRWEWTVDRFLKEVKKTEGIDYKGDQEGIGADMDAFVRVLANNPKNNDKPMEWFLQEAHKRTKALHSLGKKEASSDKKAAADKRKPDASKIPASLAQVPGGDGPGDVSDEFADIDKLDGLAYEQALAKMTPSQRERYLATA